MVLRYCHIIFLPIPHWTEVGHIAIARFWVVFSFSFFGYVACGILVPQPGIEPVPPALEEQSLNCWTTKEVPHIFHNYTQTHIYKDECTATPPF